MPLVFAHRQRRSRDVPSAVRSRSHWRRAPAWLLPLLAVVQAGAQVSLDGFVTGSAAQAWKSWQAAMQAVLGREHDKAVAAFNELLERDVSPLRLALMGDRVLRQTDLGGALILLEQDAEAGALRAGGKRVWELYQEGVEQMNQADDGFYFALVGQFEIADANFQALLKSQPDPVALLEFVDRVLKREEILILISDNPLVGGAARQMLQLLGRGEQEIKADPVRILQNIERLAGPPRQFENSVARLKDSGEHAVPFLIQTLRDPQRKDLLPAIVRTLPQIDRAALNPLTAALRIGDQATRQYLIEALGEIGYWQAVPYLLALRDAPDTPAALRPSIESALLRLAEKGVPIPTGLTAPEAFFQLAEGFYDERPSLKADPRLDTANVWYWREDVLQNVEVPTSIFNEVMAMRCCEEALRLEPSHKPALALWLAANFRREAELAEGAQDSTRPENDPGADYFAQSAGPEYCLMALARALDDREAVVALGAIAALRKTAGPASLNPAGGRQPLAEALTFPDRQVRIRAALALAAGRPTRPFQNHQNLMPVLSEALQLHGGSRSALVVDAQESSANAVAAALRNLGYTVILDASLSGGLTKARGETAGVDVLFLASDIAEPDLAQALAQVRGEFRFAALPVLVIVKPGDRERVRALARAEAKLGEVAPGVSDEALSAEMARVARATGAPPMSPESGLALAIEAADVLHGLALTQNQLFALSDVQAALLAALRTTDPTLRLRVASVLGFLPAGDAQRALAQIALDASEPGPNRIAMFGALAEAAKQSGNHLDSELVQRLISAVESETDLAIRTAASQALGALNLPANPASAIIRNQSAG
jgi:tetratricopeptide (TPR) repeat protein